jgi:hypothetical protein
MAKLATIKGEIVSSGIHPGLPNQAIPLWADGNNFVFRDLSAKIAAGQAPLFNPLGLLPGLGCLAVNNNGAPGLLWGDQLNLYGGRVAPIASDLTRLVGGDYGGEITDLWSIVQFGQSALATNGVDEIQYKADINTADEFVNLSTAGGDLDASFRCDILAGTGAFILAFNTDNDAAEYRWCDEDDPLTWLPTASNKARDIQIRELGSSIKAVVDLGEFKIIYGADRARILGFIGPPTFFSDQGLIDGIGAIGKHAVTAVGRKHYGFSANGIWVLDGASFAYLDDPSMHKYVYEDLLSNDYKELVTAWNDPNESVVYFSIPTGLGVGETIGYNYGTGAWSLYDWYRTAATSGGLYESPVLIDANGQVWGQLSGSAAFSEPGSPLGLTDNLFLLYGYSIGGFSQGGYGGQTNATDS